MSGYNISDCITAFYVYPRFRTVPYNNILHRTSTYTNIQKGMQQFAIKCCIPL